MAHSAATIVSLSGPYGTERAYRPVDESRLSGFERKCCEHVGEDPELALSEPVTLRLYSNFINIRVRGFVLNGAPANSGA